MKFSIQREIGIDAGHRVTNHGSKCRNLHGHRYTIQAVCEGRLYDEGEQQGMVLDFGFLKEEMMNEIDTPCDHKLMLWVRDPLLPHLTNADHVPRLIEEVEAKGWHSKGGIGDLFTMYLLPYVPTAENLAKHWFYRLVPRVAARSDNLASLKRVTVWETPNCMATFPA